MVPAPLLSSQLGSLELFAAAPLAPWRKSRRSTCFITVSHSRVGLCLQQPEESPFLGREGCGGHQKLVIRSWVALIATQVSWVVAHRNSTWSFSLPPPRRKELIGLGKKLTCPTPCFAIPSPAATLYSTPSRPLSSLCLLAVTLYPHFTGEDTDVWSGTMTSPW